MNLVLNKVLYTMGYMGIECGLVDQKMFRHFLFVKSFKDVVNIY